MSGLKNGQPLVQELSDTKNNGKQQNEGIAKKQPTNTNQGNQVQTDFATFSKEPENSENKDKEEE